jgi:hypothetical protein
MQIKEQKKPQKTVKSFKRLNQAIFLSTYYTVNIRILFYKCGVNCSSIEASTVCVMPL